MSVCLSLTCSVFSISGGDPAAEAEAGEGGEREEWAETQQRPPGEPGKHTDGHMYRGGFGSCLRIIFGLWYLIIIIFNNISILRVKSEFWEKTKNYQTNKHICLIGFTIVE